MSTNRYAVYWISAAALYLLLGVSLGNVMGATHDFALRSVHAHLNLLGWATMLGMGLVVQTFSARLSPRAVAVQFWIHQLALPVQLLSLTALLKGQVQAEPLVGLSSAVLGLSVLLFAVTVWRGLLFNRAG